MVLWNFLRGINWARLVVVVELVAKEVRQQEFETKILSKITAGEPAKTSSYAVSDTATETSTEFQFWASTHDWMA